MRWQRITEVSNKAYYNIIFNELAVMPANYNLHLLALFAILLTVCFSASTSNQHRILVENYDDGSEMNMEIIRDYLKSEECLRRCPHMTEQSLLDSFEAFRALWVDRMINFVIGQLRLDPESARSIRKNPGSYMINYETFKLLAFR